MTRDEIEKQVKEIIVKIRGIDGLEVELDWPLQDSPLSLDKTEMVELGVKISEAFNITAYLDVYSCTTVGDVVALVDRSIAAALDARIAEHERIAEAAEAEADRLRQLRAKRKAVAMLDESERKAQTK